MVYIWHSSAIKTAYRYSFLDILATRYPLYVFPHTRTVAFNEDRNSAAIFTVIPSDMNGKQEEDHLLFNSNEKCSLEDALICALFGENGDGYQLADKTCALIVDNTTVCNKLTKTYRPTIWQILEEDYNTKNISVSQIKQIMDSVRECRTRLVPDIENKSLNFLLTVS